MGLRPPGGHLHRTDGGRACTPLNLIPQLCESFSSGCRYVLANRVADLTGATPFGGHALANLRPPQRCLGGATDLLEN